MQVEQRHREAAAELGYPMGIRSIEQRRLTRKGERDDDPLVQAFARFEASLPPSAPDREALRMILWKHLGGDSRYVAINAALDDIAALTPSVLAESTSNDCLLVAEAVRERCAGVAEGANLAGFRVGEAQATIASAIRSLDLSGVGVG